MKNITTILLLIASFSAFSSSVTNCYRGFNGELICESHDVRKGVPGDVLW